MNICDYLRRCCADHNVSAVGMRLPNTELNPTQIRAVMINETPPHDAGDEFYSANPGAADAVSALSLFAEAGVAAMSPADLLRCGIYLTTAVKTPKSAYAVDPAALTASLPVLAAELALFSDLKVIALMGDTAKKAVNLLHKAETKKNLIPSEATYKIRGREFYWGEVRVLPSYIMTGGNILIEKSKRAMIADDIRLIMSILEGVKHD